MRWALISVGTALVVVGFVSLVIWYPEYYKLWATIGLFGLVFAIMLLRNPAYRYMRLAWWIVVAWATAITVPDIKIAFQIRDEGSGTLSFGNQLSGGFHIAFAISLLVCLALDYLQNQKNSAIRLIFSCIHVRLGGQRQTVTGGTAIQVGDVSGQSIVNVHQTDVNRELDHAKSLLEKGMPDAAEEHLLRIKRDHEVSLTLQQQFRLEAYFGQVFHDRGEAPKSAIHYRNAYQLRPYDADGRAYDALAYFIEGHNEIAYTKANDILQQQPASSLATAVMIRSAPSEFIAANLVARVHASVKDEADVLTAVAVRYMMENDTKNAEEFSRRALAKRPDHPTLVGRVGAAIVIGEANALGRRFWEGTLREETQHRIEEAIVQLTSATGSSKAPQEIRHFRSLRGLAREMLGSFTEAEADYVAAVELAPTEQEVVIRYASFLGRKNRLADALKVLRSACNQKEVAVELALWFANLAQAVGTNEDKQTALAYLRRAIGKLAASSLQQRDDTFRLMSMLTEETAGTSSAFAIRNEFSTVSLSDTVRNLVDALLHFKAGDEVSANTSASLTINSLRDDTPLSLRLEVVGMLEKLERFADVVAVLRPVATADNFTFVGTRILPAAHRCGADDFILEYARLLREAGCWDRATVAIELETLCKYEEYDQAASVCRECIDRAPNDQDRRFIRLRLSFIGLKSRQPDLIERDPNQLPQLDDVDLNIGRVLCAVLERGSEPLRAVETAYELVRKYYTSHEAHIALCAVAGPSRLERVPLSEPETIVAGTAVCIRYDGAEQPRCLVIEDSPNPNPTRQEYSPDLPLCAELIGKKKGDRFVDRSNHFQERHGLIEEVMNKFAFRAMDSIVRWADLFPNESFAITLNVAPTEGERPNFAPILRAFDSREQNEQSLRDWYRNQQVSLLTMSVVSRRHPTQVLGFLDQHPDLPIRCCAGSLEENETGRRSAAEAAIVADPSALSTLFVTAIWRHIVRLPFKLVVMRSAVGEFHRLAEERRNASDERLTRHGDELIRVSISLEDRLQLIDAYEGFVSWVSSVAEIRGGVALASYPQHQRAELISFFGQPAAESIATALQDRIPLWTDDATVLPVLIQQGQPASRTWTQLVAQRLRVEHCITDEQFAQLAVQLIALGYQHTHCLPEAILQAAQSAQWNPDYRPLREVLGWLGNHNIHEEGVFGVTVQGLRLIWRNALLAHQREAVTLAIGRTLASRPRGREMVRGIVLGLTQMFPVEPLTVEHCRDVLLRSLKAPESGTRQLILSPWIGEES